jgi:hypothetical protein
MVLKIPPSNPFDTGITRIKREFGETQEEFDATKNDATYQIGRDTYTLVFDGKLDEPIASGIRPRHGDRILTDVAELVPNRASLRDACLKSQDTLADASVDLGTGGAWHAYPNYDSKTATIASYDLVSKPGSQTLSVKFVDGGLDVSVHSRDRKREVDHTMRAIIADHGSCTVTVEGVSWQLSPNG